MKIDLYYDKECPFCKYYASYLLLKEKHELHLFNARKETKKIQELKTKGHNINDGFIVIVNDSTIIQGSDAIVYLNKLSQKKFFFYDNMFFKSFIYNSIKLLRKVVLWISFKKVDI